MKIHLISPRLSVHKGDFLGSGVPYWPVELAVFAAFLREAGNDVFVCDLFGHSPGTFSEEGDVYWQGANIEAVDDIEDDVALFVIYAISYMSLSELEFIVAYLRSKFGQSKIAVLENSQAVTAFDLEAEGDRMFDAGADFLILGEPYFNWDQISAFVAGEKVVPNNVKTPTTSETIRRQYDKYGDYPVPAWDLFPVENYWALPYSHGPKRARKYFPILTSRGCPWPCDFCVVPTTNDRLWRGRSPDNIVDEIIELRDRFGVYHFQLEDLNPTVNWPRFAAFCEALIARKAGITFSIVSGTKAETIALDAVPLLAKAGCRYLSISPESGSERLMRIIGKAFNYDHAEQLVRACQKHNIRTQACFLVGHPSETEVDFIASCDYMRRLLRRGLDDVDIFIVSPFACSTLHQDSRIALSNKEIQPTFGPKGRAEQKLYSQRRSIMMRLFFTEKLKRGVDLWMQGLRAVFFSPQTKMENLPKRVLFVLTRVILAKCMTVFSRPKI